MSAFIALFLQYLPELVKAAQSVPALVDYIKRQQATLKTTKEWTAADQETFDREIERVTSQPWWTPDADNGDKK